MNYNPPTRRLRDYLLPFIIIVLLGVASALAFRLWSLLSAESEITTGSIGQAALTEITGELEVYLPAAESWKITTTATSLGSGERVRTALDGGATLAFDDGTRVLLGSATELHMVELKNSLTKRTALVELVRGQVAVDARKVRKSDFTIYTKLVRATDTDGTYLLTADSSLTVTQGAAAVEVLDPKATRETVIKKLAVEAGETLTVTEKRVNLLRIGGEIDLIQPTDEDTKLLPLYATIAPAAESIEPATDATSAATTDSAADSTATGSPTTTEPAAASTATDTTKPATATTTPIARPETLAAPTVTSPAAGSTVTTTPLSITGTAPAGAASIEISANGDKPYALGKFKAGDTTWTYRAAESYGNLKSGANTYIVVAVDATGARSKPVTLQITYAPADSTTTTTTPSTATTTTTPTTTPVTTTTDGVPAVGSTSFTAPVVTHPAPDAVFATAPVTFRGTTSADTASIEVNSYKLGKYQAGSTSWYYNASPEYGNLQPGDNEYEITAISTTGARSSVTIRIRYEPQRAEVTPQ